MEGKYINGERDGEWQVKVLKTGETKRNDRWEMGRRISDE